MCKNLQICDQRYVIRGKSKVWQSVSSNLIFLYRLENSCDFKIVPRIEDVIQDLLVFFVTSNLPTKNNFIVRSVEKSWLDCLKGRPHTIHQGWATLMSHGPHWQHIWSMRAIISNIRIKFKR
jgi:hypothetical protein